MNEKTDVTRFDVRLSASKRRELQALADEMDISLADATRLAISRLIVQRDLLRGGPTLQSATA